MNAPSIPKRGSTEKEHGVVGLADDSFEMVENGEIRTLLRYLRAFLSGNRGIKLIMYG